MSAQDRSARAKRFLGEMGLTPIWVARDAETDAPIDRHDPESPENADTDKATAAGRAREDHASGLAATREAPSTIPAWAVSKPAQSPITKEHDAPVDPERYLPEVIAQMDWPTLKQTVAGCVKCDLCKTRTRTVFGTGDEKADWLFIGEGPGRNEDLQGEPFIGPAGKLLDNMLLSLDVERGRRAYIANVVKCRPTDANGRDRAPTPAEAAACLPYLQRQIELIQPKVLVALGKTAAISLLGLDPDTPVGTLRGQVHRYQALPLVVTYHPAYVLRKLEEKAKVWADLCLAMDASEHPRA